MVSSSPYCNSETVAGVPSVDLSICRKLPICSLQKQSNSRKQSALQSSVKFKKDEEPRKHSESTTSNKAAQSPEFNLRTCLKACYLHLNQDLH